MDLSLAPMIENLDAFGFAVYLKYKPFFSPWNRSGPSARCPPWMGHQDWRDR